MVTLTRLIHHLQSSLWSSIVASIFVKTLDGLQPNYQQQTALLLHQLLNGRDPNLAIISDPTIPTKSAGTAVAVNNLLCASISLSLCVSIFAITLKWWLTEYDSGAGPAGGLLRACRRNMWFKVFERLDVPALIAFLPTLIVHSHFLFFAGGIVYFWKMSTIMMATLVCSGGVMFFGHSLLFISGPAVNLPLFHYPKFIFRQPSFAIGKVAMSIVGVLVRLCYLALRCVTGTILFPYIQVVCGLGLLYDQYMKTWTTSPKEHDHTRVGQNIVLHSSPNDIDTSQKAQEGAVLWLPQMPLDPPDSEALISSLARISSSRHCGRFQKPVVAHANLVLEASFRKGVSWAQTSATINCVLVLGNVKFQSAVDQNSDSDHDIGGIPVPPSVAWAARQPTTSHSTILWPTVDCRSLRITQR